MITIVNVSKRTFTINDEQGTKSLAPLAEMKVKKEIAEILVSSFKGEIKIIAPIEPLVIEPVVVEPVIVEPKKGKHKK